jgi:hypothetical protein
VDNSNSRETDHEWTERPGMWVNGSLMGTESVWAPGDGEMDDGTPEGCLRDALHRCGHASDSANQPGLSCSSFSDWSCGVSSASYFGALFFPFPNHHQAHGNPLALHTPSCALLPIRNRNYYP